MAPVMQDLRSIPENQDMTNNGWRSRVTGAALIMLLTVLAYLPALRGGFVWDDAPFVWDNPLIKSADGLYQFWFTAAAQDYFPLTSTSLWLEWRLWGGNPFGYHVVNILLHALSAVLVWRVLVRLKIPLAWLAAAVFALHPVNVESVAWITERKNTLAMFFYAWALLWFLKFEDDGRRRWYWLAVGMFVLALLSKTAVAPLPAVLLGIAWWRRGRVDRRDVLHAIPFFAVAALLSGVTIWFQTYRAIAEQVVRRVSFGSRLAGAGWAVWFYLWKAVLPLNLTFIYPQWRIDATKVLSWLPAALMVGVLAAGWHFRRSWGRGLLSGLVYFILMLLPVLGFINISFMRYSLVADRWQYFSIMGTILLALAGLNHLLEVFFSVKGRGFIQQTFGAVLLAVLGILTWRQCGIYADDETLWRDTVTKNSGACLAHNNLGVVLGKQDRIQEAFAQWKQALRLDPDFYEAYFNLGAALAQAGRNDDAIGYYEQALRIRPDFYEAHFNLGVALEQAGRNNDAIGHYEQALRLKPDYAEARDNLGNALRAVGRVTEAVEQYEQVLRINPDLPEAHYNLGIALEQLGKNNDAIEHYEQALQINPDFSEAHFNLGVALEQADRSNDAIGHYEQAVRLKPDYFEAQNNLGLALVQQGKLEEAIQHYEQAVRLKPDSGEANDNLGVALAKQGKIEEAIAYWKQAVRLKPDFFKTRYNLGVALVQQGKLEEAIKQYRASLGDQARLRRGSKQSGSAAGHSRAGRGWRPGSGHYTGPTRLRVDG